MERPVFAVCMAAVLVGCASPAERCNTARVRANDAWASYVAALEAAPHRRATEMTHDESAAVEAACHGIEGMAYLACRIDETDVALHNPPSAERARRVLPLIRGPAIRFRDAFTGYQTDFARLIDNGPSHAEAFEAAQAAIDACLPVEP